MAAIEPVGGRRGSRDGGRRRRGWKRSAVVVVLVAAGALTPGSGAAGALHGKPKDPEKELAKLTKRAAQLSKEYRGELVALEEAKDAADRAAEDARRFNREWERSRTVISRLAAQSYMNGRMAAVPLIAGADPGGMIRDAAVLEHLSSSNARRVWTVQVLAARADRSRQLAETKVAEVREQIEDLEKQRARVKKLLAKYRPEPPSSGGGRPDGVRGTKSPIVGNSMTARMRSVLVAIDGKYGAFPTIGCYRSGDPQDHGQGQACDFMETTGGRMPSANARAHGDAVAQYATGNASRLGIKYVIWRQRIWDVRSGGGWRSMEDRGSVTANHYDHIHISVL
ncbi:hypothetical protein [Thermomonospora umbrina]|uniref:ARB-07466-like C-terminal domain-containing protein n=1 Tax=Thermomonospora umbrina TaxID=111806 RepID=A0A3D9T602_9ACTN|nr:hypothetical protein [Thermomonospora umbrina]REF00125.1 hypothetical protein DFJ69_5653 [Thermomonospora umbrina]